MARSHWPLRAAAGAGLLAGTWSALRYPVVQRGDVRVGDAVRKFGTPAMDAAVTYTTDLGSVYSVIGVATTLAGTGRRRLAADVLGIGLLAWNVAQLSKTRVRRQRPYEADGVRRLIRKPTGSSFPSGHSAVGVAMFTMLADRSRGGVSRRLLQAVGTYVALSRVYVGVHYPTDVIGGAGMGLVVGALWRGPLATINGRVVSRAIAAVDRAVRRA
ncbi:MAG: phosphatase PAP2 family protein [Nitriliruptorales bacterium]|nr:phosphatase PAP2 family protein [Nitriliruptorales bacterium]